MMHVLAWILPVPEQKCPPLFIIIHHVHFVSIVYQSRTSSTSAVSFSLPLLI